MGQPRHGTVLTDECCTGHHDQCDYWPDCGCPCHQEEQ